MNTGKKLKKKQKTMKTKCESCKHCTRNISEAEAVSFKVKTSTDLDLVYYAVSGQTCFFTQMVMYGVAECEKYEAKKQ